MCEVVSVYEIYVNGMRLYVFSMAGFLLLNTIFLKFVHMDAHSCSLLISLCRDSLCDPIPYLSIPSVIDF